MAFLKLSLSFLIFPISLSFENTLLSLLLGNSDSFARSVGYLSRNRKNVFILASHRIPVLTLRSSVCFVIDDDSYKKGYFIIRPVENFFSFFARAPFLQWHFENQHYVYFAHEQLVETADSKIVIRTRCLHGTGPDRFHTVPCKQKLIRSGSVRNSS